MLSLVDRGEAKVEQGLDVRALLKTNFDLTTVVTRLFTEKQRILMQYQKEHVLHFSSSEEKIKPTTKAGVL